MNAPRICQWLLTASLTIAATCSAADERELHVVGIYEGVGGGPLASVHVDRPGKLVTLFLGAYDSVDWQVSATPGTTVERVFTVGYHRQTVHGLPSNVPVDARSYDDGTEYLAIGFHVGSSRFMRAVPRIEAITGQSIASFHGGYQPPPNGFTINAIQDDARLHSSYPEPVPASELPDLRFQVATWEGQLSIREYQLTGPVDGGLVIAGGAIMNPDASGRYYYGGDDGIMEVDIMTGEVREIPLFEEIRQEGWQMGTTFDRAASRALLVTLAGEGFLYGYSPTLEQWDLRASMENRDLDSIAYHDADNSVYGITTSHEDSHYANLVRFSAVGAFIKEIPLPVLPFDVGPGGGHRSELVSVGEYLVLLLAPKAHPWGTEVGESRIYLIDPRSSQVWLTHRAAGPPNQQPQVTITSPQERSFVVPSSLVRVVAHASDRDGSIASVAFFVNDQLLGGGTRNLLTGAFEFDWSAPATGEHVIRAEAIDDDGAIGKSMPVTVRVNRLPELRLVAPAAGSTLQIGSTYQLSAEANDADGSIAHVTFRVNGRLVGTAGKVPGSDLYSVSWQPTVPGPVTLQVVATDNHGGVSAPVSIQLHVEAPETASVTATRLLPPFYQPGKKLVVVLTVRPTAGVLGYTVRDRPPEEWEVQAINNGGQFDGQTGFVTFGPFGDGRPRALVYRVTIPESATGRQSFSGTVESGGVIEPITGSSFVQMHAARGKRNLLPLPERRLPFELRLPPRRVTAGPAERF